MKRPPKPDLDSGDRVLVQAHRWITASGVHAWLPTGGYRWRVVERVTYDSYVGWQVWSEPTSPDHPSRELTRHVISVVRPGGERRPTPVLVAPVQLGLFEVAS